MFERPFTTRIAEMFSRFGYVIILCAMVGATDGLSRALFAIPLSSMTGTSEEEEKEPRERHLVVCAYQHRRPQKPTSWTKSRPPIPENSSPSLSVSANAWCAPILCGAGIYQRC